MSIHMYIANYFHMQTKQTNDFPKQKVSDFEKNMYIAGTQVLLEKGLFVGGFNPQNRGQTGSRYICICQAPLQNLERS